MYRHGNILYTSIQYTAQYDAVNIFIEKKHSK